MTLGAVRGTVSRMLLMIILLSVVIAEVLASTTVPSDCNGPRSLGTHQLMNEIQCRKLCWYRSDCVSYSYRKTAGPGYNCVIYADERAPAEVPPGWSWRPVSGHDVKNDCALRPCGPAQVCVPAPANSLYKCLPLPDHLMQPETTPAHCAAQRENSSPTTLVFDTTSDSQETVTTADDVDKETDHLTTVAAQKAITSPGVTERETTMLTEMSTQENVETSAASKEETSQPTRTTVHRKSTTSDATMGESENTTIFTAGKSTDITASSGGKTTNTTVSAVGKTTETTLSTDVNTDTNFSTKNTKLSSENTDITTSSTGKNSDTTLSTGGTPVESVVSEFYPSTANDTKSAAPTTLSTHQAVSSTPETSPTPAVCPDPESVRGAKITVYGRNPGDAAEVTCERDFVIVPRNASSIIRCQAGSLQWEPFLGTCFEVKFAFDPPAERTGGPLPWHPEQGSEYCIKMSLVEIGRAWVNFQMGMKIPDNIGLRFTIEYQNGKRNITQLGWNTKINGTFTGNRVLDPNPFTLGEVFAVTFTVLADSIDIIVHGFAKYSIPLGGSTGSFITETDYFQVTGSACAVHYVDLVSRC